MEEKGLPKYSGPADHLRNGFRSLEHEMNALHPIDAMQKGINYTQWNRKLDTVRRTYGSHLAMQLATEKELCSRYYSFPGLEHSNIALDTVLGKDMELDFADFLNEPLYRPEVPKLTIHSQMEIKYGIL